MKKILLLTLFSAFFINSYAQQLQNTEWITIDQLTSDTNTVLAKIDSVFIIDDAEVMLISSLFSEIGDTMSIVDISGPFSCSFPDTGYYLFSIDVDTLIFYLLTDSCASRADIIDSAILWRVDVPTSIHKELVDNSILSIYPNPSKGTFHIDGNIEGNMQIFSIDGKLVYQRKLSEIKNTVVTDIENGIYILLIQSKAGLYRRKLIIDK